MLFCVECETNGDFYVPGCGSPSPPVASHTSAPASCAGILICFGTGYRLLSIILAYDLAFKIVKNSLYL